MRKEGKPRNTVFQWFGGSGGRKVGSRKRRVRSQLATWQIRLRCEAHSLRTNVENERSGFEVNIHSFRAVLERWGVCRKSARCFGARRIAPFFRWSALKKNDFLQNFLSFLYGPLGDKKKEVMWDKHFFYFADGRIDRETNWKSIFYINTSIDKYILQDINWKANKFSDG